MPALPNAPAANAGILSGTVLDTNQDVVQGAHLTLRSGTKVWKVTSGGDGQFEFTGLPAGTYELTATGPGFGSFMSQPIQLPQDGSIILPPIRLSVVTAATDVLVTADKEQLSVEQVQIAEQQRVFGVIPNFYSSYDWNAPPMLAKQKYHLAFRSLFDPVSFLEVAGIAGAEQYKNVFPAYGSGLQGYAKRYGAAFANHASGDILGRAVYPALFHQDPRYFYKGTGTVRRRAFYAISAAVIARGDDGRWHPNYSHIMGNLTAGAISNLYYPASDRGASLVFLNALAETGADAAGNLIREFVLKDLTSHAPHRQHAQP